MFAEIARKHKLPLIVDKCAIHLETSLTSGSTFGAGGYLSCVGDSPTRD